MARINYFLSYILPETRKLLPKFNKILENSSSPERKLLNKHELRMHKGYSAIFLSVMKIVPAFVISLLFAGCSSVILEANEKVQGRLLIWHSFEGKEAQTLNSILAQYQELYPRIKIVDEFFPEETITDQFRLQARSGLGPDLMISSFEELIPLIQEDIIEPLNEYNLDLSSYLPRPMSQVTLNDNLYGLPFVLTTQALCYNKTQVEQPLQTLPEMIVGAESKLQIAVPSNFLDTLWGVEIFRAEPDNRKLDNIGVDNIFEPKAWGNWLAWLRHANKNPNFILSSDTSTLKQIFTEGQFAYYICDTDDISDIKAILGADKLGVTTLPGAANQFAEVKHKPAGPTLYTKAIVFNRISSNATTKSALQLASFLTNVEQQTKLAVETESLIPANSEVQLDKRLSPIQAVLLAQSKTAVAVSLKFVYEFEDADEIHGDLYYNLVMAGEMAPMEAAEKFGQKIQEIKESLTQKDAMSLGEE